VAAQTKPVETSGTPPDHQVVQVTTILIDEDVRLDARYWQEAFRTARSQVFDSGLPVRSLGGDEGVARVWFPGRFKRVYALDDRFGVPFLRAHATFYAIPESDRLLSKSMTRNFETYLIERGWLLLACSGTLGAVTYATDHIAQFAVTHDLVRIVPESDEMGHYLLAFLQTSVGRLLTTHDEHGSAVPHISDKQAARIPVPILRDPDRSEAIDLMRKSVAAREKHTRAIKDLRVEFLKACKLPDPSAFNPTHLRPDVRGWEVASNALSAQRVDAEFFSPTHQLARELVERSGLGVELSAAAEILLPNRYKRVYVEPEYGTPQLGGRHIHQWRQIGLQHIADRAFSDPEAYTLRPGMSVFSADGRAQEKLGEPAYVTSLWDGWKGSDHLMRASSLDGRGGLLYLALASPYVQIQLRASATGSVVDDLTPDVVAPILIPLPGGAVGEELDARCVAAFEGLAEARRTEDKGIRVFEDALGEAYRSA
jgi:type I restriction enzyme S subunit